MSAVRGLAQTRLMALSPCVAISHRPGYGRCLLGFPLRCSAQALGVCKARLAAVALNIWGSPADRRKASDQQDILRT